MLPNALCTAACFLQFFLLLAYGRHPMGAPEVAVEVSVVP